LVTPLDRGNFRFIFGFIGTRLKQTDTKADGWQRACMEWAKAQEMFEVRNVSGQHLFFLNEFCAAYKYKYQSHDISVFNLVPESHNSLEQLSAFPMPVVGRLNGPERAI
jgi:hypothetical protein